MGTAVAAPASTVAGAHVDAFVDTLIGTLIGA